MPNQLVDFYRQQNPQAGNLPDEQIMDLYASEFKPEELAAYPDFVQDYQRLQANRAVGGSSIGEQLKLGVQRGLTGLEATGAGAMSLLSDVVGAEPARDWWREAYQNKLAQAAQETPASVPKIEEAFASPASFGQYVAGKAGELIPNLAEMAIAAGIGSAIAPGPGTAAAAAESFFARSAARSALKSLIQKGLNQQTRKELEEYAAGRIGAGALSEGASKIVTEASKLAGATGASMANFAAMGAGGTYGAVSGQPGVSDEDALTAAFISGAGSSIGALIPARVLKQLFPTLEHEAAKSYVDLWAKEVPKELLSASGGMGAMEFFNVMAEKYADPKRRDSDFSTEDYSRILNAAVVGAMAGIPAAGLKAVRGIQEAAPSPPAVATPSAPAVPAAPVPPAQEPLGPSPSILQKAMTPEQIVRLYPPDVTADFEHTLRTIAERDVDGMLTRADRTFLRTLQVPEKAKYETIKTEVSNAIAGRKEPEDVQTQRVRDDEVVQAPPPPGNEPTVVEEKGAETGPGHRVPEETGKQLTPEVVAVAEAKGIDPATLNKRPTETPQDWIERITSTVLGTAQPEETAETPIESAIARAKKMALAEREKPKPEPKPSPPAKPEPVATEKPPAPAPPKEAAEPAPPSPTPTRPPSEPVTPSAKPANWIDDVPAAIDAWAPIPGDKIHLVFKAPGQEATADGRTSKQNTRALGIFKKPDGTVIVATVYSNAGKRFVSQPGDKAVNVQELLDAGWQVIGRVNLAKGKARTYFYAEHTPQEWESLHAQLDAKAQGAKAGVIEQKDISTRERVEAGVSTSETPNQRVEQDIQKGRLSKEEALLIHNLVVKAKHGLPSAESAQADFYDAMELLGEKPGLWKRFREIAPNTMPEFFKRVAQAYEEAIGQFARLKTNDLSKLNELIETKVGGIHGAGGDSGKLRKSIPERKTLPVGKPELADIGQHVAQRMADAGVKIEVLQAKAGELVRDAAGVLAQATRQPIGGVFNRATKQVTLIVSDLTRPTREDIRIAFEEAGHVLFDRESPEVREPVLRAISKLDETKASELDQVKRDIANAYPEGIGGEQMAEELLMGVLSKRLAGEGFNPIQARTLADTVFRFFKDLYLRSAMWLQKTILGDEYSDPNLALRFWRNRLEGFLAGEPEMPSLISRLGGGKAPFSTRVRWFDTASGSRDLVQRIDPLTGKIETDELVPDSVEAVLLNLNGDDVRYSIPMASSLPTRPVDPSVFLNRAAAVNNEVSALRDKAAQAASETRQDFDDLNGLYRTQTIRERLFGEALEKNATGFKIGQRLTDFSHQSNIGPSHVNAIAAITREKAKLGKNLQRDKEALVKLNAVKDKVLNEAQQELDNYTDAEFMGNTIRAGIKALTKEDMKRLVSVSRNLGTIMQQVKDLADETGQPIDPKVVQALQRLYTGESPNHEELFGLLDIMANDTAIDWSGRARDIARTIKQRAAMIPDFTPYQQLLGTSPEARALMASVIGYAKVNRRILAELQMRRMQSGQDRVALEQQLKDVWKESREQISVGIRQVAKAGKLQEVARREYRVAIAKANSVLDNIKDAERRVAMNEKALPFYDQALEQIGQRIQQTADTRFGDGMVVRLPVGASPRPAAWEEKTINLNAGRGKVTTSDEVKAMAERLAEFVAARQDLAKQGDNTALDMEYRNALRQLQEIWQHHVYDALLRNTDHRTTELILSAAPKALEAIGFPSGQIMARLVRQWVADTTVLRNDADKLFGYKLPRLHQKALGILNHGRKFWRKISQEWFTENVIDAAVGFAEKQQPPEGVTHEAYRPTVQENLANWLMSQEHLRPLLQGRMDEFMPVLMEYIESLDAWGKYWTEQNRRHGLMVEDPKLAGMLRAAYPQGWITVPRKFSVVFTNMAHALANSGWETARDEFLKFSSLRTKDRRDGTNNAAKMLAKFFEHPTHGDTVRNDFWFRVTHVPDVSSIESPRLDESGTTMSVDPEMVSRAYAQAKGDVIGTFESIHTWMNGAEHVDDYIQDSLLRLADQYDAIAASSKKVEPNQSGAKIESLVNLVPNFMIDSRQFVHWPSEWFTVHKGDRNDNARVAERVAGQIHFGRESRTLANLHTTLAQDVSFGQSKLKDALARARRMSPTGRRKQIDAEAAKILAQDPWQGLEPFKTGKERLEFLRKVDKRARFVAGFRDDITAFFNRQNSEYGSLNWAVRFAQSIASLLVNQPSSALSQLATLTDIPVQWGTSPTMIKTTGRAIQLTAKDIAGSLAQAIGWRFLNMGEYESRYREMAQDPEVARRFGDIFAPLEGEIQNVTARTFRTARDIQSFTINLAGEQARYTALRPAAPFFQTVMSANRGLTVAIWEMADNFVRKGMRYLESHPGIDPIKPENLGLTRLEKDGFERFNSSLERYGLKFDEMARQALERQRSGDKTILTDKELGRLYSIALNEISLESNVATMPLWAFNSRLLRFVMPLLGWTFRRAMQIAEKRLSPQEEKSLRYLSTAMLGLGTTALGGLGLSLAVDWYQEELVGKKRNIRALRIPMTGQDWLAIQERLNRVGTFGLFGEMLNSAVNVGTGQGDNRLLSVDQRVVAFQAFKSLQQAIASLVNQNFDPDYAHVVRPAIAAIGGNGVLQYLQLANRAFDLDNVESRVVKRINAQNYLRVVGREMEFPIRTGGGAYNTPTPLTPWIARMEYAAYTNNPDDFREAYRGAIAEARDMGKDDPADYIKRSFETRHPLRFVFSQVPSELEYRQMLSKMDERGQESVTEAVRLFNHYAGTLGLTPFQGSVKRMPARQTGGMTRGLDLSALRARALYGNYGMPSLYR